VALRHRLRDFSLDEATGLRLSPASGTPAGYLDGGEARLAEIFASAADRSTGSAELQREISDWVTLYHLSPYRVTLLDALDPDLRAARVLELGAGCGAMTRWLGEHCAEVHAVEGDADRAQVARLRCRDQDNVEVYVGNYSELDEQAAFDVVTLVGVLEYGHHYHPDAGGDPHRAALANLTLARRALAADGVLVLAIENRLGLKYLGGAREDHSGRPYDSVTGYPAGGPAQTFNVRELRALVTAAGFADQALLLPFPDYKLARTIINAAEVLPGDRIHNWVDTPAPDRGFERGPLPFDETLATREIARAGLLEDLANSVLVLAFAGDRARAAEQLGLDLDWVARHWSLDRRPGFAKRATLRRRDGADAVVVHEPAAIAGATGAGDERRRVTAACGVRQRLGTEPFRRGDLLSYRAHEALAAEGLGGRVGALVREHAGWLARRYGTGERDGDGIELLAGSAFDAVWWNIVVDPDSGDWTSIDEEWELGGPIPLDAVVRRTLQHFAERNRPQLPAPWHEAPAAAFAARGLQLGAIATTPERRAYLEALEAELQRAIAPGPLDELVVERVQVVALAEEAIASPELLVAYASRFAAEDPVTLVLYAPAAAPNEIAGRLELALAGAGLDPDSGPDLVLLAPPSADAPAQQEVAAVMSALLTAAAVAPAAFADLPRFGADALDGLCDLVTRWTSGARA
jgi:SAM-dependent methyltransferase